MVAPSILEKGTHKVAIGQMEGGGGSRIRASFRTPEGAGPALMATIDPTDPSQDGLWVEVTELNSSQAGEHFIEYTATDQKIGNQTKAVRTLIVESVKGAPAIYLEGSAAITPAAGAGAALISEQLSRTRMAMSWTLVL